MKEYGGYIEFETYRGNEYHEQALRLNCGRSAFEYLLINKKITKVYLPYFICSSVFNTCSKVGVPFEFYHISPDFHPLFEESLKSDEYLYVVNYYGQLSDDYIEQLQGTYHNVIVDNSQAFFNMPLKGIDTLYTCRKFFGLSDGAYLYTDVMNPYESLPMDVSYDHMKFIMGRFEKTASEFYSESVDNNHRFADEGVKKMSSLTENLLRSFDYEFIKQQRSDNFSEYNRILGNLNKLDLCIPDGAFMYPLYLENGYEIRKKLQQKKIYIPVLWPDVFNICSEDDVEYDYARNILPLPVDQRYRIEDVLFISSRIMNDF